MQVAHYLVPRIRDVLISRGNSSTYIRFLTGPKAYVQILSVSITDISTSCEDATRPSLLAFPLYRHTCGNVLGMALLCGCIGTKVDDELVAHLQRTLVRREEWSVTKTMSMS